MIKHKYADGIFNFTAIFKTNNNNFIRSTLQRPFFLNN